MEVEAAKDMMLRDGNAASRRNAASLEDQLCEASDAEKSSQIKLNEQPASQCNRASVGG
jgi:hypothetical protein